MKFFLDTADLAEIEEAASWGVLAGVTTNPTLYARTGGKLADFHNHIKRICEIVDGPVSAESVAMTRDEMVRDGRELAALADNVVVKLPTMIEGLAATKQLAAEGIHARVINIHTIKPLDEEIVLKAAKECGKVITAEEHNVIGGLGEAVCAVLSEKLPTPVRRVGVQDVFGCSGPAWDLLKKFGLDAATICKTAHEMLGK